MISKEELSKKFGGEEWFSELLLFLHEVKVRRNVPVTDILIREGEFIYFSTIKAFQPLPNFSSFKNFKPKRENIVNALQSLGRDVELSLKIKLLDPVRTLLDESAIDFSFAVKGLGIYRCNASFSENLLSPDGVGLGLSVRVLDFEIPDFDFVFYPPSYREMLREGIARPLPLVEDYKRRFRKLVGEQVIKRPEVVDGEVREALVEKKVVKTGGLVLHVGPTGSGKTTTIASEIGFLARETTGTIITYEKPIEYRYFGFSAPVRQYELGYHIKDDPEVVVKHLLRVNPSVVLYGEARTLSEMRTLLDVANRGHLVFSTLHANNVKEALGVLLSACSEEPYLLANSLISVIAHKLILNKRGEIVPLFEVFIPDKVDRTLLAKGELKDVYRRFYQENVKDGGWTFKEYLEMLVQAGILDVETKMELMNSLAINPM